VRTAQT